MNTKEGNDEDFAKFVSDLKAGAYSGLIIYGANPVYNTSSGNEVKEAISKLKLSVSFNERADETSSLAQYICPIVII